MDLEIVASTLVADLAPLRFGPPVAHVYNPLEYAWEPHRMYLRRYGAAPREVILLGMNPGPFGMAQTGVPFGDVGIVREWLGIQAPVGKPAQEHPKRQVLGFECPRSEVSGSRLWGWARETFGTPEAFFQRFFVANYCPLIFLEAGGRNRTPDKLPAAEREPLFAACDAALRRTVEVLQPRYLIGVGAFAEGRAAAALGRAVGERDGLVLGRVLHPSPASPRANRGWAAAATAELRALGVGVVVR